MNAKRKKEFTIKRTGYVPEAETIIECLEGMDINKTRLEENLNSWILANKKDAQKEFGQLKLKRVRATVTINIEEI